MGSLQDFPIFDTTNAAAVEPLVQVGDELLERYYLALIDADQIPPPPRLLYSPEFEMDIYGMGSDGMSIHGSDGMSILSLT